MIPPPISEPPGDGSDAVRTPSGALGSTHGRDQASGPPHTSAATTVIFDCDGVLVDSELLSCSSWLPVLARRGIYATLEEIRAFIGRSDGALMNHFERLSGVSLGPEAAQDRENEYFRAACGTLRAFQGVHEVLIELRARGARVGVASSGTPRKIQFNLEQTGLGDLLPLRCSSVEVARGKPEPDLFLLALSRLGAARHDAVVVEDSLPGIEAARRAGMRAVGFTSSHSAQALRAAGASAVFRDYSTFTSALATVR